MKSTSFIPLALCLCISLSLYGQRENNVIVSFGDQIEAIGAKVNKFTIKRAEGRLGEYKKIGVTDKTAFEDNTIKGSVYKYYYKIFDSHGVEVASFSPDNELFGPNVYFYSPGDDKAEMGKEINDIETKMHKDQFSKYRYSLMMKPGDYTEAGILNVGYYTHIGGLGDLPLKVKVSSIHTPAPLPRNNATCTFWRIAENLSVIGPQSDEPMETFMWGVSQAAPIRRIYSERNTYYQWLNDGWASGGFTADCYFEGAAGSFTQQQWYTRNSYIEKGRGKYSIGGWNLCYQGVEFGLDVNLAEHSDNWATTKSFTSRVETTPVIREKPFLFIDDEGRYKVFRPALREENSKGVSWSRDDMGKGVTYDLLNDFYVVKPGTKVAVMNAQLAAGKHLLITPGLYELSEPLIVKNANTIILGIGLATLIPDSKNPKAAMILENIEGVTIAGLLFDAHYSSEVLLQVGTQAAAEKDYSSNPTLLADLYFRVGGFREENVNVDVALKIDGNNIIGDHFWIWRADHGAGVGWEQNTSRNGLIVNGHDVTIYGLFNEHFQEYQSIWNGENGRMYFYQCETPYDVPNQAAYMSHNNTVKGYASYKVGDNVNKHEAYMLGIYDVFTKTNGADIQVENSIEVPKKPGVKVHHACNVSISPVRNGDNARGFNFIINGIGKSTYDTSIAARFFIIDYPEK